MVTPIVVPNVNKKGDGPSTLSPSFYDRNAAWNTQPALNEGPKPSFADYLGRVDGSRVAGSPVPPNDEVALLGQNPAANFVNTALTAFGPRGNVGIPAGDTVSQAPPLPAAPEPMNPADIAMLNTARAAGQGYTPPAPAGASGVPGMEFMDLGALIGGITSDSGKAFDRLQEEAGARGAATSAAIGGVNAGVADTMAAVGADVGGDGTPRGGLSSGVLTEGAQAGSQGMADVQATLGGFLQQSQERRTNAWQNYLGGLEGQAQVGIDRARTAGEFLLRQQQALLAQEAARNQNDIAARAAEEAQAAAILQHFGLPAIPGLTTNQALELTSPGRLEALGAVGGGGPGGQGGQPQQQIGKIGEQLGGYGIPDAALPGFEQLEFQMDDQLAQVQQARRRNSPDGILSLLSPMQREQAENDPAKLQEFEELYFDGDNPTREGVEALLSQNVAVTSEEDPRLYQQADLGGGRGSRFFITQDDYDRYLQWAGS